MDFSSVLIKMAQDNQKKREIEMVKVAAQAKGYLMAKGWTSDEANEIIKEAGFFDVLKKGKNIIKKVFTKKPAIANRAITDFASTGSKRGLVTKAKERISRIIGKPKAIKPVADAASTGSKRSVVSKIKQRISGKPKAPGVVNGKNFAPGKGTLVDPIDPLKKPSATQLSSREAEAKALLKNRPEMIARENAAKKSKAAVKQTPNRTIANDPMFDAKPSSGNPGAKGVSKVDATSTLGEDANSAWGEMKKRYKKNPLLYQAAGAGAAGGYIASKVGNDRPW